MTAPANAQEQTTAARPYGPHPGQEPRRNPAARWISVLTGLVFVAIAGVIARELWYRYQDGSYSSWLEPVYRFLATAEAGAAAVTVGIIISLVGLWLIITAFVPRAHTHLRINSPASMWMRPVDAARKSTHATRTKVGGENIRSKADRKTLSVQVEDNGSGHVSDDVAATLNREFRRLATPPAVNVKVLPPTTQPAYAGAMKNTAPEEELR